MSSGTGGVWCNSCVSVQVLYAVLKEGGGVEEECHTIVLDHHTDCRCGCQEMHCSSLQVIHNE